MTPALVLDLDTVADPSCPAPPPAEGVPEGRLPAAPHHEIVVGAWATMRGPETAFGWRAGETATLREIVTVLAAEDEPRLVTWNGRGFDLPVVAARCMRRGVPFPAWRDLRGRSPRHVDLCAEMSDGGASPRARLDSAARLLGLPGKEGEVGGAGVAGAAAAGDLDTILRYCLSDVAQLAAVYLRWRLLVGELRGEDYDRAVEALCDAISAEPMLAGLAARLSPARMLERVEIPEAYRRPGPSCPACASSMTRRVGPRGPFWGCDRFPACRGTIDMGR